MFTKTASFDLKGELRTFALMGALSCFAVVSHANAEDVVAPESSSSVEMSEGADSDGKTSTLIDECDRNWIREESGGTSTWYGIDNEAPDGRPSVVTDEWNSSEASSSSSLTPKDLTLSSPSSGGVTKTYDGSIDYHGGLGQEYNLGCVEGNNYVGGLVGETTGGEIVVGYNTGTVVGENNVGGLVGYNVGGIVGQNDGGIQEYNLGCVEGNTYVGGLVGYNVGGIVGQNDGGIVNASTNQSDNVLQWKSFDVAENESVNFDGAKGSLLPNGENDGFMGLENRHESSATSVSRFSVAASGLSVLITGAKIGSSCVLLNAQGRVVASPRVASANFVVNAPHAGTYFVRIDGFSRRIIVK